MKTADIWAYLILTSMPEKPLELEGMWRSCTDVRGDGLLYVAEFKKNELIEDYYGYKGEGSICEGRRLFHYKRTWDLKYNNFNFIIKYKESGYIYKLKEGAPNWFLGLRPVNEFTYRIRGETLETNHKGNKSYLTRIEYPIWFKSKEHFWSFFNKTPSKRP